MFERQGCPWCRAWHREVGPAYPKTTEARLAPLRRVDVGGPRPADLKFLGPIRATPTFVVVHGGREYGRIEGYPGDDMFWGLLAPMVNRLPR